jgi:hypothetical protein
LLLDFGLSGRNTALSAALVGVCCYFGSRFELAYPEIGTAILFAPYAILTAALLYSPRRWSRVDHRRAAYFLRLTQIGPLRFTGSVSPVFQAFRNEGGMS